MLIVVEGPDGSGKTTFINELSTAIMEPNVPDSPGMYYGSDTEIMHSGPLRENPLAAYELRLKDYDPYKHNILIDRWHIGELIYGPLLRGRSQLTPGMKKHIDLLLTKLGAVKIFMDTDYDTVIKRCRARGEDLIPEQHMRLIWDSYREQCTLSNNWLPRSKFKLNVIIETARTLEMKAKALHDFPTYVGSSNPMTLIIGHKRGHGGDRDYPWAFTPYPGSAGDFLMSTLVAADCRGYGMANIYEEPDIGKLWEALAEPRIVVLGNEAKNAVPGRMRHAVVRAIEHPRLVASFKMGTLHAYGKILAEAING